MWPTQKGSIRLFRFAGIDVFLHWTWFILAVYLVKTNTSTYSSVVWVVFELLALFAIIVMHEFGHALACRQVGGEPRMIVLWPFGGVAYVSPPQRPGATLWSIAAGPLVNVVLAPILIMLWLGAKHSDLQSASPDLYRLVFNVMWINYGLLIFNLLPIFPLDGGQILWSLLWFVFGRAQSLMIATIIGFIGVTGLIVLAVVSQQPLTIAIAVFILLNCWGGLMHARLLARIAKLPRRQGYACPSCGQPPVLGAFWRCSKCLKPFDTFETCAHCPHCGADFAVTKCLDCGVARPIAEWGGPVTVQEVNTPPPISTWSSQPPPLPPAG